MQIFKKLDVSIDFVCKFLINSLALRAGGSVLNPLQMHIS